MSRGKRQRIHNDIFILSILAIGLLSNCSEDLSLKCKQYMSEETLAPRLLHDEKEMESYLESFPRKQYKIQEVPQLGKFYLDNIDDHIKNVLRRGVAYEEDVDALLKKHILPGTIVLDVGAHIGTHTMTMARAVGREGCVFAFEPQKKIFRELVHNLRLNKVKNAIPLRFAIGEKSGMIEMRRAPKRNEGGTSIGRGGDQAEMRTIDSFGFQKVSLMKIDVEHYEDFVLEGARHTIQSSKPILIVEIMGGYNSDRAPRNIRAKIDATKKKMQDLGYIVEKFSRDDYLGMPK